MDFFTGEKMLHPLSDAPEPKSRHIPSKWEHKRVRKSLVSRQSGLEITAGQRTMSGLIWEVTGQPFVLPVMLTGHVQSY